MKLSKFFNITFFTLLTILFAATLFLPKRRYSKSEGRALAVFPKLNAESLENGEFQKQTENYLKDHVVFRNTFLKASTDIKLLMGNRKINGVFVTDEFLTKDFSLTNTEIAENNLKAVNTFFENHGAYNKTALMLMPTAVEFQKQEFMLPEVTADQIELIKSLYQKTDGIKCADSYSALQTANPKLCFYKTDSRLTSYGAYVQYAALSKTLSFKAVPRDMFNIEHASHSFSGDCRCKTQAGKRLSDSVDLYFYSGGDSEVTNVIKYTGEKTRTYSSVFFREYLEEPQKTDVFLGKSEPVIKIKTTVENGEKLLVFCDSKAYPMMQFLPLHYEEVTLVNLDLLNEPLENYLRLYRYSNILITYDIDSFSTNKNIGKLSEI